MNKDSTAQEFESILGKDRVVVDDSSVRTESENTFGLERNACGILYPKTIEEVSAIVSTANKHRVAIYPVSRGKNIGYGQKTPAGDNQWILDLGGMIGIHSYDPVHGYITVEPGVTQIQLFNYLKEIKAPYWIDTTGAGTGASIVGNSVEGGFGHTPMGNHRKTIRNVKAVLGNGTLLSTGDFPGLGPDLAGMFVQSNFGVIVSIEIELMAKPKHFESFLVRINDDKKLEDFVERMSALRQQGTVTSIVHIANAVRTFMTISEMPKSHDSKVITDEESIKFLSFPMFRARLWNTSGGLYGTYAEVQAKKKAIKEAFRGVGNVMCFSDRKLKLINFLFTMMHFSSLPFFRTIAKNFKGFMSLHGLLGGIPSDEPMKNIHWRIKNMSDLGLIWCGPTIGADRKELRALLKVLREVYKKYGFDLAITMSFVEPAQLVGIINITFNKNKPEEKERALKAYAELQEQFKNAGIRQYRTNIMAAPHIEYPKEKQETFRLLKQALDPNNTISPGRYGVGVK